MKKVIPTSFDEELYFLSRILTIRKERHMAMRMLFISLTFLILGIFPVNAAAQDLSSVPESGTTSETAVEAPVESTPETPAAPEPVAEPERPMSAIEKSQMLDNSNFGARLFFALDVPTGFIFSPDFYYRTFFRPLNRPIYLFFNPHMGIIYLNPDEIDSSVAEPKNKAFGFRFKWSVGYPLFYKADIEQASVATGTSGYKKIGNMESYALHIKNGMASTHTALLVEFGMKDAWEDVDYNYRPYIFYGLRYHQTKRGKIQAEGDSYYPVKQIKSVWFHLYKWQEAWDRPANVQEENWRTLAFNLGMDYTVGGSWGAFFSWGLNSGNSEKVMNWIYTIGVTKPIGLWRVPL
ncbi:MAG: hypothetical protein A2324_18865 [Candidatus Raymondbacteria bacterium RIFOXYB2_FULL_49_35]|nr:MAG: hypothetical protein A2324_18865 [Candidatus Raymondbacteria bacterium RIFOXYB2_FULL_49_35]